MAVSAKGPRKLQQDKEAIMNMKPVITPRPTNPTAAQRRAMQRQKPNK